MNLDEALQTGAMALFGEKYGDRVRVIKIGDFSTELCGGTHLDRTGEIGFSRSTTEGAVASGVRRVEAVAGTAAVESVARSESALREAADILKIGPLEVPPRLQKLLDEQRALEKQLASSRARLARSRAEDLVTSARQVNGVAVIAGRIDGLDADGLRAVADTLRDRLGSGVVCVGSVARRQGQPDRCRHEGPHLPLPGRQAHPGGRQGRGRRRRRPPRPRPGRAARIPPVLTRL